MLDETIKKIEEKINKSEALSEEKKGELLKLMASLRNEVETLAETQQEDSESITRFAESSTDEALKTEKDSKLFDGSLDGLKKSVEKFESSHPELTKTVNNICTILANLGI